MNFKVGQKVVCIDDKTPSGVVGEARGIRKGRTYEIAGFDECEFCGLKALLIKGADSGSRKECHCGRIPIMPNNAFAAYRFKPLIEEKEQQQNSIKERVEAFIFN